MFNLDRLICNLCSNFYTKVAMFAVFLGMGGKHDCLLVKHEVKSNHVDQKCLLAFLRDIFGL